MAANPAKLKAIKDLHRREILFSIARVPNSSELFVGSSSGKIFHVDPLAEKPEWQELAGHTSYVTGLVLAGDTLISGSFDGQLMWWNAESREQLRAQTGHEKWIRKLALAPDGKTFASVADDMVCRVWEVASGKLLHELKGHAAKTPHHFPSMLYACCYSPDGAKLATVDRTAKAIVWDAASGQKLAEVEAPILYTWDPKQRIHSIGGARSLAFSPDGALLAIGGMGKVNNIDHLEGVSHAEIFDWQKQERTHELIGDGMKGLIEQLLFLPDGKHLIALGGDNGGWLQCFDLETKKPIKQEKAPAHLHAALFNETSETLFVAGHERVMVFDLKDG